MPRPEVCVYCNGTGLMRSGDHSCGFCTDGVPLDTEEDWNETWGKLLTDLGIGAKEENA